MKTEIKNANERDMNAHLKWEYIKIQIKSLGIVHGKILAAEKGNRKKNAV